MSIASKSAKFKEEAMKTKKLKSVMYVMLCIAVVFALGLMAGCSGSDGANGLNGTNGSDGAPGTPGTSADQFGTHSIAQGKVDAVITITSVQNVGGKAKVSFNVADKSGKPVATVTNSNLSVKIADLIPHMVVDAGTGNVTKVSGDNTFSTDYWEMWVSESPGRAANPTGNPPTPATNNLVSTDAANGNYSYTFVTPFGSAWPGYNNAGYAAANKKRVAIEMSSPPTGYNKAVGILDFDGDPGSGKTATAIDSVRQFVTIAACQQCHGPYMDNAAHASNRNDMRECVFCHSALYGSAPKHAVGFMADDAADLPVFIHKIHGNTWTDQDDISSAVTGSVTYPEPLQKCDVCHSDPSGAAPADLSELTNWKTHPTGRVCASCHTTNVVTAATTTIAATFTHDGTLTTVTPVPGGAKNDAQCVLCHSGNGTASDHADIVTAHNTALPSFTAPAAGLVASLPTPDSPEYIVSITTSTPANGKFFVAGEQPVVTINLTNNDAGKTSVAGTLVTSASHTVGYYDPTSLSIANMYVYGPRTSPRPSFLPAGRTDNGAAASTTSVKLLQSYTSASRTAGNNPTGPFLYTDASNSTTATGWVYTLAPVPAGTLPGTYFVRVYLGNTYTYNIADGGAGTVPDQVVSYGLAQFQVGTATVDKRIAGDPDGGASCRKCHGVTVMHPDDHAAPFDPDHCNACHYIGAYGNTAGTKLSSSGDPIANRVHAVHSASVTGDLKNHDWTEITYPSNPERCAVCHNSGNTAYKSNLYEIPCYGCHADVTGAAAHMSSMGGSLTSVVSVSTSTVTVPESCGVCHGPGRETDVTDTP
jgi:OmcA/MtrC family decaheme c-type cytochrome